MAISLLKNSGTVNTSASVDIGSGSSRYLIYQGRTATGSDSITAVSVGSLSLTKIGSVQSGGGPNRFITMWAGKPTQTGSQTLTITGTEAGGSVLVYDGVKVSVGVKNFNSGSGNTSGAVSLNITANNGDWIIGSFISDTGSVSMGSNTTVREDASSAGSADSNGVASPTALAYTLNTSGRYGLIGGALEPAPSIVCSQGSFTFTDYSNVLTVIRKLVASVGSIVLTGISNTLSITKIWSMPSKNTTTWTNQDES
jgi:hypothetical protein